MKDGGWSIPGLVKSGYAKMGNNFLDPFLIKNWSSFDDLTRKTRKTGAVKTRNNVFWGFVLNRGQVLPKKGKKRVQKVIKKVWPLAVTNILMPDFRHAHTLQHTKILPNFTC